MRSKKKDAVGALLAWAAAGGWFVGLSFVVAAAGYPTGPGNPAPGLGIDGILHGGFVLALVSGIFFMFAVVEHYFRSGGSAPGFGGFALSVLGLVLLTTLEILALLGVAWLPGDPALAGRMVLPRVSLLVPLTGGLLALGFAWFSFELQRTKAFGLAVCSLTAGGAVLLGGGLALSRLSVFSAAGAVLLGIAFCRMAVLLFRRYGRGA